MDASHEPAAALPRPLPGPYPGEPTELAAYRRNPGDEKAFVRLRRTFRDQEDWRALATLLVVHAAHMEDSPEAAGKAAELCIQASELWLERVKDRTAAAHALARAVVLKPDHQRAVTRLRKLYESMSARKELVALLRWQLRTMADPEQAATMHVELADMLREHFVAVGEAVQHYEQALELSPGHPEAMRTLIELYLGAGAHARAAVVLEAELQRPTDHSPLRAAELHRRLAKIESEVRGNVAGAARHLQAALELVPDDIDALRAFGELYLGSTAEGAGKAADIFYKAAEIARRQQRHDEALKLLRRALSLAPDHQEAAASLESTLIDAQDWMALDDLYREWLLYDQGADAVPLMLRRADLLETRLYRREEARALFEEASRYEPPDGESWRRLEQIYSDTGDVHALAALLEARSERMPEEVPTDVFLRTAKIYRDDLGNDERAAVFYYKVLEREPFNPEAFEGYKEHWRRKHNWTHLRDLILYQIQQATAYEEAGPLSDPAFAEEFVELADICERRLGDIDGALDAWQQMASLYPRDARPHKAISRIEKRARMWDNMVRVQEAELARTVDPRKRLDILKRLTQVYRDRQVNPQRAIELYREILELSPGDVQATRALTALYDRAGDFHQVSELLREQYERSRSPTEQNSLLRRLAEIWHHELEAHDEAIWACETILQRSPADREALVRLQQILEEQQRFPELLQALQRELDQAGNRDARVKVLRRMARVAEHQMGDEDQAASIWTELLELLPGNLEITDKVISLFESTGRYEELGTMLHKAASSSQTPEIRRVDYLLRLAHLAESSLDDIEVARASFENVLKGRPDHRGALEALVRLYRADMAWKPLVDVLGRLQGLAETADDAFRIAWERSEILSEQLEDSGAAIEVLEALGRREATQGNADIARTLLELYERAGRYHDVIRQAERVLLATEDPASRHQLYLTIANTWLRRLEDKAAALAAYARLLDEFTGDTEALDTVARLQVEVGDFEGALASLQRRLDLLHDPLEKTGTLVRMSEIAEKRIGDGARALDLLRRALAVDHYAEEVLVEARRVAQQHQLWRELLGLFDERFVHMSSAADVPAQLEVCFEASEVAEERYGDAEKAFDWARRGFFVAVENDRPSSQGEARLRELADAHHLWNDLLGVIEEEIAAQERRGAIARGTFDVLARLQQAADLALERLDDAPRAVALLQRAYRHDPDDLGLAERLEQTARDHRLWAAVIELHGSRLERATTDQGRFAACEAIARVYEEELDDPEKAFEWLRQAWVELRYRDVALAQQAIDRLLVLSERHSLWAQLANHHLLRATEAFEAGADTQGLADLREAAQVFDQRLEDPLGALRVLASGLPRDPGGDVLLPDIRHLSERVDERRAGDVPAVGALLLLEVQRRLIADSRRDEQTLRLLEERAELREARLDDPRGAMAEWLRIAHLRPDDDQALVELERLADDADAWEVYLILPGWRLDRATGDPRTEASLLRRLAHLYEGPLERPEYALRARLEAWRREPELPPLQDELDPTNAAIWRLAEQTGAYHTPPVPKDPLLRPNIEVPELDDLRIWTRTGLDPEALLSTAPSPFAAKLDVSSPQAILRTVTEEVSLRVVAPPSADDDEPKTVSVSSPLPPEDDASSTVPRLRMTPPGAPPPPPRGVPVPVRRSSTMEIDEIDEVLELDDELIEVLDEDLEGTVTTAGTTAPIQQLPVAQPSDGRTSTSVAPKAPPPPPRTPEAGMPPIPRLLSNVLPPRPRVASAWEEVAATYAGAPTRDRQAQVLVALVLARLWEHGAGNLERAFQAHEQALLIVPEDPTALESLRSLAERHNVLDRLLQAYLRLLAEATLPRQLIAQNLRIAALHETRDDLKAAEASYKAVQEVAPRHVEALQSLLRIYSTRDQPAPYVETLAELIEAQREQWPEDTLVERSLELTSMLHERLGRSDEAVEHLELLVRQCPRQRRVHEALIGILVDQQRWQQAIEVMRVGWTTLDDDDFRFTYQVRAAELYEEKLELPDRALATLQELTEIPEDRLPEGLLDDLLAVQQRLYTATARAEELVATIDRRLERIGLDAQDERISLLVAKARALQEGLGDEAGAMEALETLHREAPDRDEVVRALARMYRKAGRYGDGIALLRDHWHSLPPDSERALALAIELADVMADEGGDARGAQPVIETALEHHPKSRELLDRRVALARTLHEPAALVEALQGRGTANDLLEAARLLHHELASGPRAMRLYSRVLGDAKRSSGDPAQARRLAAALEGLVELRVGDGDIDGAMEFMDKQLAEVEGPAIRAVLLAEMGRITYQSTHDIAAARGRFDAALAEDPEHAGAKLGLARILLEADELPDAEALLTTAVDALALANRQEDLVDALVLLAEVLERTDRSGEAYRRLTAALRHDPDNLEIRAAVVRNRHRANRHRDAVTAVDQIEQRLAEQPPTEEQRRMVSDTFVLAALSELAQKHDAAAYARYRRAAELDGDNPAALEPLVAMCQEHGEWTDAAVFALALARQTEELAPRTQRFVEAAQLYFDAAAAVEDAHDPNAPNKPEDLRQLALQAMRSGLDLAEGNEATLVERGAWEAAFHHASPLDPVTALRILERLLRHEGLGPAHEHDLLLEGVHLAIAVGDDRLDLAERFAAKARMLVPESSAAVLAHAEVLQAGARTDEIEPLVESFFATRPAEGDAKERRNRITLLLRLAELQSSVPKKAAASLERAAALSPDALGASERRRLAELYGQLGRRDETALDNHRRLLEQDPLFVPSLSALAAHHAETGELDHAWAIHALVDLVEPGQPAAREFLETHSETQHAPEGPMPEEWVEQLRAPAPPDAGVGEALLQLWEGGGSLLAEVLPRVDVPPDARVSPLGEGVVAKVWAEMLRRLGQQKVALVDTVALPDDEEGDRPDAARDGGYFHVRGQNPPVILADGRAWNTDSADELRFALGRAVYFTRPDAVFAAGLRRVVLARLLSATFQAFHPRHMRRRHHARSNEDDIGRLGQELARKLPMKVSRRLTTLFKTHEDEAFDTPSWRAWVRRCGNRVGLALCGDLRAALRVMNDGDPEPRGEALRQWAEHDGDVRDLLVFATSSAYVTGRRGLGVTITRNPTEI
ncbi:MAG: tetratricopeptide repeat protein [Myxococcales bacterium]|nr:tetratricopeptide repeat protein [Myxococcales bacterium]